VAGRVTDQQQTADDVVQVTGWVFNSDTDSTVTLADFVASGDAEVPLYLETFGLSEGHDAKRSIVEIGSGIGRMTCAFTRRFGTVYACDLDAGFLERCREAVARFGRVERLRTVPVPDGRTLDLPDETADVAFSYITLQHCSRRDAVSLVNEAVRVLRPGGLLALNFRARSVSDTIVLPLGVLTRAAFNVPGLGSWLTRRRLPVRFAWQANRMDPHHVLQPISGRVERVTIWRNPSRTSPMWGVGDAELRYYDVVNASHWWLVATKSSDHD
jgi:ubiquinone/menaquinone biosynthesis C-methylase UbiE